MSHHKPQYTQHEHETPQEWFRHTPAEEGLPQEEHGSHTNPLLMSIAFVGSVGFVAVTILATVLYFQVYMTNLRRERIESDTFAKEFFGPAGTQAQGQTRLNDFGFAYEDAARAGRVSVPIDQAMQNIVARYPGKN